MWRAIALRSKSGDHSLQLSVQMMMQLMWKPCMIHSLWRYWTMLCITSQIALWFEYWRIFNRMISLTNVFGLLFIHEWWSEDLCRQQPFTIWYCFACHFCWFLFNSCSVSNRSSIFIGSDDVIKVCILLGCYISRSIRRKCRNKHQCLTEHSQLSVKIWLILIGSCFVLSAIQMEKRLVFGIHFT